MIFQISWIDNKNPEPESAIFMNNNIEDILYRQLVAWKALEKETRFILPNVN